MFYVNKYEWENEEKNSVKKEEKTFIDKHNIKFMKQQNERSELFFIDLYIDGF